MASKWPPVKNSAYKFRAPLFAQADNQIKSTPTIAAGDFKVSTDGGAFGNLSTLPSEEQTGMLEIDLSASEMNGDEIVVKAVDAAGDEWHSAMWTIHTVAQTLDTIDTNVDSILTDTAVIGALGAGLTAIPWNSAWDAEVESEVTDALNAYDPPTRAELTSDISGLNDPTVAAIADAVWDEAATGHTDAGKAGAQLWTDVDAILADTNELQTDDIPTLIAALPTAVENRTEMDSNSTQLAAIVADTNELQTDDIPALIAALNDLSAADVNTQVDAAFNTQMADSVPADGTIPTREQAIYMITQFLLERAVSGTTVTVKKVDGSTSLMTLTLNDGTSPTSITRAT